jgi:oligogalacturonide lyase
MKLVPLISTHRSGLPAIAGLFLLLGLPAARLLAEDAPPTEWIDPDTGHRVIRLSREPGTASLYFNQNAYTADGKKLIVTTPDRGIATIDLETRALEPVVAGPVSPLVTGHKTGDIYYMKRVPRDGATAAGAWDPLSETVLFAVNPNTRKTREIAHLAPGRTVASLNADETLLVGAYVEGGEQRLNGPGQSRRGPGEGIPPGGPRFEQPRTGPDGQPLDFATAKEAGLHDHLAAIRSGPPHVIFTVNTATGEMKDVYREREWLNHLQFSPTDPTLILFCHEGPWHEVDRIWTVRTDGSGLTRVHARTLNMEIAGHEFFSGDGRTIWYDLQTPRGEDFWVAGFEIASGRRTWYHLQRNEWSVHFNVSPDGTLFAGDGGDNEMVAHAPDGKWIYLFRPQQIPDVAGIKNPQSDGLINAGYFKAERLVNMARHNYQLEPNVTFSPDMKWIIFRSNMYGKTQVYAVEIARWVPAATPH